jgi:hypothetical protein
MYYLMSLVHCFIVYISRFFIFITMEFCFLSQFKLIKKLRLELHSCSHHKVSICSAKHIYVVSVCLVTDYIYILFFIGFLL